MNKVIVSAKTVEEAVEEALGRLDATRGQVRISVLEEPRRGWFGLFGARPAKVEVERIAPPVNPVEQGLRFLKEVLSTMGLSVEVEVREEPEAVTFDLRGDQLGLIIGRRGQTLDALQYLVNIVANRGAETRHRFILDAGGFRERRRKTLQDLADRLARQVLRTGKEVKLEPMSPADRKVIHTRIQTVEGLTTYSEGEEPDRRVIIAPKK
ncbi:MAG: RNA-binding cell elongation regulator Jag/EloR [Planifilum fimeticola]